MFDQSNGQVFKEWTVHRDLLSSQPERLDWSRKRPYPRFKSQGAKGPRSLADMAINVVGDNIGDISESYLEQLPATILWRLWRYLEVRGVCLHAWKFFSKLSLTEEEGQTLGLYRFRQHICQPSGDITRYTEPLTSPSFSFITHLVISGGCSFTTHEMLCLADIKSLGVLELIQPADDRAAAFPQINDRLVRGWTEKDDPFPLLRILKIWGDQSTTKASFQWVSKFPHLALYDVMGAKEDWRKPGDAAQEHGWELVADTPPSLEDSLLKSLLFFTPLEDAHIRHLPTLSKRVDLELVPLCSNPRSVLKFVPDGDAPELMPHLLNSDRLPPNASELLEAMSQEARGCHGVLFETWAFWLYSFIGQLSKDRDLKARGVASGTQTQVGSFVLPSKPMACVHLGHTNRSGISTNVAYVSRGLFMTRRYTFTRKAAVRGEDPTEPEPIIPETKVVASERTMRTQKRKRIDEVLQMFGI